MPDRYRDAKGILGERPETAGGDFSSSALQLFTQ
jgi:hypothetical protein